MKQLLLLISLCVTLSAQILGPFSASTNHTDDLLGTPDNRPQTWGLATYNVHSYKFNPPSGYSTRILEVYGNFQGFVRNSNISKCAGVLWGMQTTAPEGSSRMVPAADNTFLYIQDATCGQPFRVGVLPGQKINRLLEADNILLSKVAVFLNETKQPVHMEASFTVVYQFEPSK